MHKIIFIKFPAYFYTDDEAEQEKIDPEFKFPNDGAGSDVVEIECEISEIAQYWPSKTCTTVYTHAGNYRSPLPFLEFKKMVAAAVREYNNEPPSSDNKKPSFSPLEVITDHTKPQRCPDCDNIMWPETLAKYICRFCGREVLCQK